MERAAGVMVIGYFVAAALGMLLGALAYRHGQRSAERAAGQNVAEQQSKLRRNALAGRCPAWSLDDPLHGAAQEQRRRCPMQERGKPVASCRCCEFCRNRCRDLAEELIQDGAPGVVKL